MAAAVIYYCSAEISSCSATSMQVAHLVDVARPTDFGRGTKPKDPCKYRWSPQLEFAWRWGGLADNRRSFEQRTRARDHV